MDTGKGFDVNFGTLLVYPSIKIGDNVKIGVNSQVAKCNIGNGVNIGSNVYLVNPHNRYISEDGSSLPTPFKKFRSINIGENSWIGNSSVIMDDIGKNCIIGAGSVVLNNIPDNAVAWGNPCKLKE